MRTMHKILPIMAAAMVLLTSVAGSVQAGPADADKERITQADNAFALELYASLKAREGNLFFSPLSLSAVLAMAYPGARGNTAAQMAKILHFQKDPALSVQPLGDLLRHLGTQGKKDRYELVMANAIWLNKGRDLLPDFRNVVRTAFDSGIQEADFSTNPEAARLAINAWTDKQTSGKIKDILPQGMVGPSTKFVLTNAMYFKGMWGSSFNADHTSDAPFVTAAGKSLTTPMMTQTATFGYLEEKTFQVLEMPYQGNNLSMVVLLPKANNGLPEFEKILTQENLNDWMARLVKKQLSVYIPRFTLRSKLVLAEALKTMGMTDAFSAPPADFSGIDGRKELAIGEVVHEAFVDVNERGTEAAAASVAGMEESASFAETEFVADHPFVFMIRDRQSGSILFVGRVESPEIPSGTSK